MDIKTFKTVHSVPVADPGYPRGGRLTLKGSVNLLFTKNCMKMKKVGPRGGAYPRFYYPPLCAFDL